MKIFSTLILSIWILSSIFGHFILPFDPYDISLTEILEPPSLEHIFGTDQFGRDILARTIEGGYYILIIAPLATMLSILFGTLLGLITANCPKLLKEFILGILNIILSFPMVIIALLLLSLIDPSPFTMIGIIAFIFTPIIAKNIKIAAEHEMQKEYAIAAMIRRQHKIKILIMEILPNLKSILIAESTARLGYTVFLSTTLSFLGVGFQPPTPDWGLMIQENQNLLFIAPWTVFFPAICLALIIIAFNLLAESFQKKALS